MNHITSTCKRLILSGLFILVTTLSAIAAEPVINEQKAADINGVVISMKDLTNQYRQILKQMGVSENGFSSEETLQIKKELLDRLVMEELLYQESKKENIVVEKDAVADSIAKIMEKYESEEAFQKDLANANIQRNDLEVKARRYIAINKLIDEQIRPNIAVTDEESKQYYDTHPDFFLEPEQVKVSHILVKVDKEDGEVKRVAAREKIAFLQNRIKKGEDFAQLARENSDCPSGAKGGDLGYLKRGMIKAKTFEDTVFASAPGTVSDIVETEYGYHLIKVMDKKEAEIIPYDTVETDLRNILVQQKLNQDVSSLVETLRKDAKIEIYL